MKDFSKLLQLQNNIKSKSEHGKISKSDYCKSLKEVLDLDCTPKDIHKTF